MFVCIHLSTQKGFFIEFVCPINLYNMRCVFTNHDIIAFNMNGNNIFCTLCKCVDFPDFGV